MRICRNSLEPSVNRETRSYCIAQMMVGMVGSSFFDLAVLSREVIDTSSMSNLISTGC